MIPIQCKNTNDKNCAKMFTYYSIMAQIIAFVFFAHIYLEKCAQHPMLLSSEQWAFIGFSTPLAALIKSSTAAIILFGRGKCCESNDFYKLIIKSARSTQWNDLHMYCKLFENRFPYYSIIILLFQSFFFLRNDLINLFH